MEEARIVTLSETSLSVRGARPLRKVSGARYVRRRAGET
jgi:hypothetical protein